MHKKRTCIFANCLQLITRPLKQIFNALLPLGVVPEMQSCNFYSQELINENGSFLACFILFDFARALFNRELAEVPGVARENATYCLSICSLSNVRMTFYELCILNVTECVRLCFDFISSMIFCLLDASFSLRGYFH
jgi:hypothetical protein